MDRPAAAQESFERFDADEEEWFAEPETRRSSIPPPLASRRESTPPAPIGDDVADHWFR
jgi:hypothetical protein